MKHEHTTEVTIARWYTIELDLTVHRSFAVCWEPDTADSDEDESFTERRDTFPTLSEALERATYLLDSERPKATCCVEVRL